MARIFEVDVPSKFKDVFIMSFSYLTIRIREICIGFMCSIIIILYNDTNLYNNVCATVAYNFAAVK